MSQLFFFNSKAVWETLYIIGYSGPLMAEIMRFLFIFLAILWSAGWELSDVLNMYIILHNYPGNLTIAHVHIIQTVQDELCAQM